MSIERYEKMSVLTAGLTLHTTKSFQAFADLGDLRDDSTVSLI